MPWADWTPNCCFQAVNISITNILQTISLLAVIISDYLSLQWTISSEQLVLSVLMMRTFFPHSLFFEQQRWQNQIFLQICISLYTYCFVRITLYVAFLNPLSWNTLSSRLMCLGLSFPSSFSVSPVLSFSYWRNSRCCE